jgi:hypothetical protein
VTKKNKVKAFKMTNEENRVLLMLEYMYPVSLLPSKDKSNYWMHYASTEGLNFRSGDKTGKWCIVLSSKDVDSAWIKVKEAIDKSDLILAKVSTLLGKEMYNAHVICVYTKDWSNVEDLNNSRAVLKDLGFTQPLNYKRDIETMNNIYGENEFYLTI